MLGGSYIKNADGTVTLVQRTEEVDDAKAVAAAPPKPKPTGKSGEKDT